MLFFPLLFGLKDPCLSPNWPVPWVLHRQTSLSPEPPACPFLFFAPPVLFFVPSLCLSSTPPTLFPPFCLGRHPGQIVALRISLKGCWWSAPPCPSKCARVHLTVHCLEMDYRSRSAKGKENGGYVRSKRRREDVCLPDEGEFSLYK